MKVGQESTDQNVVDILPENLRSKIGRERFQFIFVGPDRVFRGIPLMFQILDKGIHAFLYLAAGVDRLLHFFLARG